MQQQAWWERLDKMLVLLPLWQFLKLTVAELPGTGDRIADQFLTSVMGRKAPRKCFLICEECHMITEGLSCP